MASWLRPINLLILVAFVSGIGLAGWQQYHRRSPSPQVARIAVVAGGEKPAVQKPEKIEDIIAAVDQAAQRVPTEIFDFRQHGQGVSSSPTHLAHQQGQLQQYEEPPTQVAALAPVLPLPPVADLPKGRARIAIVIDDVGPDYRGAQAVIALPPPVTLAFLPYAEHLKQLTAKAHAAGHEMLVHMPMEPQDLAHNNPGPGVLLTGQSAAEQLEAVRAALDSFSGYVGINNHMGSRFTSDMAGMDLVLTELARRQLIFLDSRTTPQSVGEDLARRLGLRYAGRDVFLDNEIDEEKILAQLRVTERVARAHGQAIAIGHPHAQTIAALERWLPEARRAGFELVPISRLARKLGPEQVSQR